MFTRKLNLFRPLFCFLLQIISLNASRIVDIDFDSQQFYQHHTASFYDGSDSARDVIIRRGAIFHFVVALNSQYNGERVDVSFTFSTKYDNMVVELPSSNQGSWRIHETYGKKSLFVKVYIPGNTPVGAWKMTLTLKDRKGQILQKLSVPNRIIVLFNPWSTLDSVFMNNSQMLREYVLNEQGVLFRAFSSSRPGTTWLFNQFKEGILDAVLFVLNKAKLNSIQRGDPVMVARQLKYWINDNGNDIRGVLKGRWTGQFDTYEGRPATPPTYWAGSAPILMKYYKSGGIPVAFGQCWVYAGVMTTMLRALGIPTRPITTFYSGIDSNKDLSIDRYYNENGFLDSYNSDSYWNFHVWVQAWMSRNNDLGHNNAYNHWQEIDGTPQMIRGGYFQNGPASTAAIKQSQVDKPYDSVNIYSAVNADLVVWRNKQIYYVGTNTIGAAVWTKAIGSNNIDDITYMYKPAEGTQEERKAYLKAANILQVRPSSIYNYRAKKKSVTIKLVIDKYVQIGSPVKMTVFVKNPSFKLRHAKVGLKVASIYYTGEEGAVIAEKTLKLKLKPLKTVKLTYNFHASDYIDKLKEFYTNRVEAVVITDDGQWEHDEANLEFLTPSLNITCPSKAKVNQPFYVEAEFTNPLNKTLEKCFVIFEGERIERRVISLKDVLPFEKLKVQMKIKPKFPRNETILIKFVSKSLSPISGSANVEIIGKRLYPIHWKQVIS